MDSIHYFVLFTVVHPFFFSNQWAADLQLYIVQRLLLLLVVIWIPCTIGKRQKILQIKWKLSTAVLEEALFFPYIDCTYSFYNCGNFVCSKCNSTFMIILLRSTLARTWTRCSKNNSSKTVSFHTLFGVHFKHHFLQISDYLVFDSFQFQTHFWWNILDNLFASYFKVE